MRKQTIDFFDRMAKIIKKISEKGIWNEKDFLSVLENKDSIYRVQLSETISFKGFDTHNNHYLSINDLNEHMFLKLDELIDDNDNSIFLLLLLLYYMDRAIVHYYDSTIMYTDDVMELTALNSNIETTGIMIFRRVKCNWKVTMIQEDINNTILDNFYYVNMNELNGAKIKNYSLNSNNIMHRDKKYLRVAVSPLTKKETVCISKKPYVRKNSKTGTEQYFFNVQEIYHESELTQLIYDNICFAGENEVDILVFPEMLGTRKMLNTIQRQLYENENIDRPVLIVFPSIWEKSEDNLNNTNSCCVIFDGEEIMFEQNKRLPFKYVQDGVHIYEDINTEEDNNVINILHIDGIGRICVCICYDYLDNSNRRMILDKLLPTLIISPSFSTGSFNFVLESQQGFDKGCNWIWCNSCSALNIDPKKRKNFDIAGIVTLLSKCCNLNDKGSLSRQIDGIGKCTEDTCIHCVKYVDIPLKYKNYRDWREVE